MSLVALLATLVLLFGFQGEQIIAQPLVIALLAVPILIQVYFNAGLAYLLNRSRAAHCVAGPSALIGASNFSSWRCGGDQPVSGSTRARRWDRGRRADRGAVMMLTVVWIVNRSQGWYEARATRNAALKTISREV